ncbi:putative C-type lectin domain family 20 member A [Labrus mixtus]|uniref:putative C-type lectin domain family 20 member A n=1 Tax=Labrus mixtus TaxID=508554 RepID=UPI0029C07525|nr:putative C-type lectin domain family 20 member A [Labrus mixtus]
MDYRLALLLSVFGLCSPSLYVLRQFHYIDLNMTWADAQHYCRDKYSDLVTIESASDISRLNRPDVSKAWIGLHDDPEDWKTMGNETNSWRWSSTGATSKTGYYNWVTNRPDNWRGEFCVMAKSSHVWDDTDCNTGMWFLCYTATNPASQKTYVLIQEAKNWKNAQTYCRTHHTDLAMIENAEEFANMVSVKGPRQGWIGLYREAWRWSDNRDSSFRNWKVYKPDNYHSFCVMSDEQYQWDDIHCKDKLPFWCQEVPKQHILMKLKIQTDADLSDPAVNAKLLQQLDALLPETTGQAHLKLKWKIQPRKQEEEKEKAEDQCPLK